MELLQFAENEIDSKNCDGSSSGFSSALTVWLNKPHVVNRRLCGSRLEYLRVFPKATISTCQIITILKSMKMRLALNSLSSVVSHSEMDRDANLLEGQCKIDHQYVKISTSASTNLLEINGISEIDESAIAVIVRQMLPKQPKRNCNIPELVIYDKSENFFVCFPLQTCGLDSRGNDGYTSEIVYGFRLTSGKGITLVSSSADFSLDSERKLSLTWIQNHLLNKLAKWSEQPCLRTELVTLRLVSVEEYSRLYSELKNKYGLHFAQIWPETTNPQKYVFEDVAIATYLLLLWEDDRRNRGLTERQSFVDLGCGNGLLVHILVSEGHPGYGIDVRRRNIWDLYGPGTVLKEMSLTPSADSLFPECDWLIGNHSDELTPWIPIIAARSSYWCNYFVLPCCPWDFNARFAFNKTPQTRTDVGKCRQYLDFVKTVGEKSGFMVEEDMLRIPSTKRVCFIGRSRLYLQSKEPEVDRERQFYISERCQQSCGKTISIEECNDETQIKSDRTWVKDFTPRSKIEVVRNCVAISKHTKDHVVRTVFDWLLHCNNGIVKARHDGEPWRLGGCMPLSQAVELFDKSLLQELKSECGGLQTLLRNHSHIFQVSGGQVQLRDFTMKDPFNGRKKGKQTGRADYIKTTLCWFCENHPDGCPRLSSECFYAHGVAELKERPQNQKETKINDILKFVLKE